MSRFRIYLQHPSDDTEFFHSFPVLWEIGIRMIQECSRNRIFCLLDGLDECNEGSIESLLAAFSTCFNPETSMDNLRLVLVCRPPHGGLASDLAKIFVMKIDLDADTRMEGDLKTFINTHLGRLFPKLDQWRNNFEKRLLQKSEGSFIWISFVVRELNSLTQTESSDVLERLPTGLGAIYETRVAPYTQEVKSEVEGNT